jgi:hypothetical protein
MGCGDAGSQRRGPRRLIGVIAALSDKNRNDQHEDCGPDQELQGSALVGGHGLSITP